MNLAAVLVTAGFADTPADTSTVSIMDGNQTVVTTARTDSYRPENVQVESGVPTTLVVRSEGCSGLDGRTDLRLLAVHGPWGKV